MKVCWISAGVSSFIAGWLVRDSVDEYIYIDVADQHPDSMRFIKDCENALGKPIQILRSEQYHNVDECIRVFGGVRNVNNFFYPCTNWLKKRVRKRWEEAHAGEDITYVWGMDMNEQHRADRLVEGMPQFEHEFPLIDKQLTKAEAHGILATLGIKRPVMYDMGYSNNNCIGCVRGGIGYWNKIRVDFPEVFEARAKMERDIGVTILKDDKGPIWLDELAPNRGKMKDEIMDECDIFCMMHI
jgi:hypothetical protein